MKKYTQIQYECEGCGAFYNEKDTALSCEEKHPKDGCLCKFVIGDEYFITGQFEINNYFHITQWIPYKTPIWKIPMILGNKEYFLEFEITDKTELTSLKQKRIPVFRLINIDQRNELF